MKLFAKPIYKGMRNINSIYLFTILKELHNKYTFSEEVFESILKIHNVDNSKFEDFLKNNREDVTDFTSKEYVEAMKEIFHKDNRNYFTISSKSDFNNLLDTEKKGISDRLMVYSPLNNHSRKYLKKSDVFFCYRQGQMDSLTQALETRGIYGVGFAVSDPLLLFPEKEGHNQ